MAALLADTHAAVWHLDDSARLSPIARTAFAKASQAVDPIYLASISQALSLFGDDPRRAGANTSRDQLLTLSTIFPN